MATIKEIFGTNLRKIRKEMGLSQEKFAEIIKIQPRNLTAIENAKYMPTPSNIDKICQNLNIPVSRLFQIPDELVDELKLQKIQKINQILTTMTTEQLIVIQNIVNNAFRNIK